MCIRDRMEFIGRLFSDEKIEPTRKKELLNIIKEKMSDIEAVSYTHLRAHETVLDIVCRLLLEKKTASD